MIAARTDHHHPTLPRSGGVGPASGAPAYPAPTMVPWSPRRWLAQQVGCTPDELRILARSDDDDTIAVTYETPRGEQLTVVAVLTGDVRRVTVRHGLRWLRADVPAERALEW